MISQSTCREKKIAFVGKKDRQTSQTPDQTSGINVLERLIQLTRSNDRLVAELATAHHRLGQAIEYAGESRTRAVLGATLVEHARKKQAKVSAQLRANRIESLALLAKLAH